MVFGMIIGVGCAGNHCIKGEYQGIGFEYCYDPIQSQAVEGPIFHSPGGKVFGFKREEIRKIYEKMGGVEAKKNPHGPEELVARIRAILSK